MVENYTARNEVINEIKEITNYKKYIRVKHTYYDGSGNDVSSHEVTYTTGEQINILIEQVNCMFDIFENKENRYYEEKHKNDYKFVIGNQITLFKKIKEQIDNIIRLKTTNIRKDTNQERITEIETEFNEKKRKNEELSTLIFNAIKYRFLQINNAKIELISSSEYESDKYKTKLESIGDIDENTPHFKDIKKIENIFLKDKGIEVYKLDKKVKIISNENNEILLKSIESSLEKVDMLLKKDISLDIINEEFEEIKQIFETISYDDEEINKNPSKAKKIIFIKINEEATKFTIKLEDLFITVELIRKNNQTLRDCILERYENGIKKRNISQLKLDILKIACEKLELIKPKITGRGIGL